MRRPSFQFYPADWQGNSNLRRCTHAEKGAWTDILCLLHDQEEYGILRWSLKEIAQSIGAPVALVRALAAKTVMKGTDTGTMCQPFVYTPRSGRKDGNPIVLVEQQLGPIWFSSRMVKDEYVRKHAGASTRFGSSTNSDTMPAADGAPSHSPSHRHGEDQGDGSSSSSSSSYSVPNGTAEVSQFPNPRTPEQKYFDDVVDVLGDKGRSLGAKLLKGCEGNCGRASFILQTAASKHNPREWLGAVLRGERKEAAEEVLAETKAMYKRLGVQ